VKIIILKFCMSLKISLNNLGLFRIYIKITWRLVLFSKVWLTLQKSEQFFQQKKLWLIYNDKLKIDNTNK